MQLFLISMTMLSHLHPDMLSHAHPDVSHDHTMPSTCGHDQLRRIHAVVDALWQDLAIWGIWRPWLHGHGAYGGHGYMGMGHMAAVCPSGNRAL
jgi:hypothetical protein